MSSTQFLELAISLSVQVSIVIIVAHWLGNLVDSERIQTRLWTVCYGILLLLTGISALFPHPRLFLPWTAIGSENASTLVSFEMHLGRGLFWIWLGGTFLSLLVFLKRSFQVSRFLKTCTPVDVNKYVFESTLNEFSRKQKLPGNQRIQLLSTNRLKTPFCTQFHYPYIVIPEYLLNFEPQKFNFVIRHELEHLQTGHPLQLFLQRLVEVIFWFHPMVWWASHRSALSREYACDEAAINSPQEIAQYLRTLLTIIEYSTAQSDEIPTPLAFVRGQSIIASRARRLTQIAGNHSTRQRVVLSGKVACAGLLLATAFIALIWLPVDVLASPHARWSPWPTWSADTLHDFGVSVHDFETYNGRMEVHELLQQQ